MANPPTATMSKIVDKLLDAVEHRLDEERKATQHDVAKLRKELLDRIDSLDKAAPDALFKATATRRLVEGKAALQSYATSFMHKRAALVEGSVPDVIGGILD